MRQKSVEMNIDDRKIRFSTRFLGIQLFTFFINFTGWDSVTFAIPFWIIYVLLRFSEKGGVRGLSIKSKIISEFWPLLLWMALNIFEGIIYIQRSRVLLLMLCYMIATIFFIVLVDARMNEKEIAFIIKMYTYMGMATTFLILIERVNVVTYTNRFTLNVLGHNKDPNFMAAYLLFPAIYSFYNYLVHKSRKGALEFLVVCLGILLTGSRAAFLGVVISISTLFLCKIGRIDILKKAIAVMVAASIVIFILLPNDMASRFNMVNSLKDDSNHLRLRLWKAGLEIFLDHVWFGAGQNAMITYSLDYGAPLPMMAHNTFIEILVEFGCVGFLLFCYPAYKILIKAVKNKQSFIKSIMVGMLFATLIISAQNAQYYWFNLALCSSMSYNKKNYK
ncbi:O-antigen ligase family protein [Clostridium transplantifaecale]|uniref:O-antigen ligase family protein n=1 Tax=Clostridium transplantifaecale TaxID=2479838 RepID=UPI000F63F285|nr:O-antigen ligase family protein [Clostridium transplantifaecale]